MAFPSSTPYHHRGVQIPFPIKEWSIDNNIQADGFIFLGQAKKRTVFVQSVKTGHLLVNKLCRQGMSSATIPRAAFLRSHDSLTRAIFPNHKD